MIFAVIGWLFTLLVYMMVFYSLNFTSITFLDLAMVYCVSSTVETITAGFPVGAVEITMTSLYSALGVPLVIAGAATTLTRLLTFWFQIIVGYPLVEFTGLRNILKGGVSEGLSESQQPAFIKHPRRFFLDWLLPRKLLPSVPQARLLVA
jgi:uncharacterized membrane protein YbhN (UPF0104 family)